MEKPPAPPSAPATYGLGRMLEDSVTAALRPAATFRDLAGRPAPSYGVMAANLLVFCAVAAAAAWARAAAMGAASGLAAACAAAWLLAPPAAAFAAAAGLHGLMLLAGAAEGFRRSCQAASMLGVAVALQALLNSFDLAWALPCLLAAYVAAAAAWGLHRAPAARAAAVFGLAAALCLAGQWKARQMLRRPPVPNGGFPAAAPAPAEPIPAVPPTAASTPSPNPAAAASPASGLDLLSAPRDISPTAAPEQARAMQQAAAGMLSPVLALLNDPRLRRSMSAEQSRQIRELSSMLRRMQEAAADGTSPSPQETAAMTRRMQALVLEIMSQAPAGNAPPGPPGARSRTKAPSARAAARGEGKEEP